MAEFNQYMLYSINCGQCTKEAKEIKENEMLRTINAFINFHNPQTYEERKKFVQDALQGRNYNQTLEYDGETMDFEFLDDFVRVTLHSPEKSRDNRYFQYSTKC